MQSDLNFGLWDRHGAVSIISPPNPPYSQSKSAGVLRSYTKRMKFEIMCSNLTRSVVLNEVLQKIDFQCLTLSLDK